MKKIIGGRELLTKAKTAAKRQDKQRVKRLEKRHAKKLAGMPAPVKSEETAAPEISNQK
jgi:hypothetical protein